MCGEPPGSASTMFDATTISDEYVVYKCAIPDEYSADGLG